MCITGKFRCEAGERHAIARTFLDRAPYPIYLLDRQLALIEHHKMPVQILVLEQHIAIRIDILVTAGSARFLNAILRRSGYVEMHHKTDIGLFDAHAERRGRNDNIDLTVHEFLLVRDLFALVLFPVERELLYSVRFKACGEAVRSLDLGNIDDRGAFFSGKKISQRKVFLLVVLLVKHLVPQIMPRRSRGEKLYFKPRLTTAIVADIADYLLFCGGGKAGNGDRIIEVFILLQSADKVAYVEIVNAEILSPREETVRPVYDKTGDVAVEHEFFCRRR